MVVETPRKNWEIVVKLISEEVHQNSKEGGAWLRYLVYFSYRIEF